MPSDKHHVTQHCKSWKSQSHSLQGLKIKISVPWRTLNWYKIQTRQTDSDLPCPCLSRFNLCAVNQLWCHVSPPFPCSNKHRMKFHMKTMLWVLLGLLHSPKAFLFLCPHIMHVKQVRDMVQPGSDPSMPHTPQWIKGLLALAQPQSTASFNRLPNLGLRCDTNQCCHLHNTD